MHIHLSLDMHCLDLTQNTKKKLKNTIMSFEYFSKISQVFNSFSNQIKGLCCSQEHSRIFFLIH